MDKFPIAEGYWGDAWIDSKDYSLNDAKKLKPIQRKTVGYLINKTEDALILVTDLFLNEKDTVNTTMVIPLGMVSEWYQIGD